MNVEQAERLLKDKNTACNQGCQMVYFQTTNYKLQIWLTFGSDLFVTLGHVGDLSGFVHTYGEEQTFQGKTFSDWKGTTYVQPYNQ
jgi:hypothetical protein